jgi:hypothetical protein
MAADVQANGVAASGEADVNFCLGLKARSMKLEIVRMTEWPDFASAMASYEVVHVDIGTDGQSNGDLAKNFQGPLDKGIPAPAVLKGVGKLAVPARRKPCSSSLNKWKAETRQAMVRW